MLMSRHLALVLIGAARASKVGNWWQSPWSLQSPGARQIGGGTNLSPFILANQ